MKLPLAAMLLYINDCVFVFYCFFCNVSDKSIKLKLKLKQQQQKKPLLFVTVQPLRVSFQAQYSSDSKRIVYRPAQGLCPCRLQLQPNLH